jgi:small conductance mechanosensitive channel
MILIYRPYDVGDVVEIAKVKGTVLEMSMVSTTMLSFNNEKLVIPNNSIWGSLIRNITSEATRRIDLVFKISFDADIDQLDKIFSEEVNAIPAVLAEPAPTIELNKQHETHLEFIVRPWVKTSDYWSTYWRLNKSIQKRMQAEGVPKLNPYEFLKPLINKA